MRLVLMATLMTLAVFSPASSQTKSSGKQGEAEQTLRRIEQELNDTLAKGDASANQRYLADTVVLTDTDGTVMDKAQFISDIRSGALKVPSIKLNDMRVQLYGDTAVVTWRSIEPGTTYKGKDLSGQYRWTDVFIRRNENWQMVASQGTRISKH